jgi:hypothetical protein
VRNGIVELIWFVLGTLVVAGVPWIVLVLSVALGNAGAERLRRQQHFDPVLIELGLTILGPVGAMFFLLWLLTNGYARLIPGLLCGVVGAAIFFGTGARRGRFGSVEAAFSLGALVVGCTFIVGVKDLISKVGESLETVGLEYGPLARLAVWLAAVSIAIPVFKFWERNARRRQRKHSKKMQDDATYRKLFEEKCQLEGRLKDIHKKEEWYESEIKIPANGGTK